jgi:transcriptional regulator with XRE-family HTH domain
MLQQHFALPLKEVGRRVTQVREVAGIKQVELARRIGWSPAVLSRSESGERQLSLQMSEVVCQLCLVELFTAEA